MDHLNTHSPRSFYEALFPAEAQALTNLLEIHYTPKHGSWLNIAVCELSVLSRQCLGRHIESAELLASEVAAWKAARNEQCRKVNWQFRTSDARIKLRRLYPEFLRRDTDQPNPHPTTINTLSD